MHLTFKLMLVTVVTLGLWIAAASAPNRIRSALQLPVATAATGHDFYGACVEGDDFVWCIDRSDSMGWTGALELVKPAVIDSLLQLSPDDQFMVMSFGASWTVLAGTLIHATPDNVQDAIDYVSVLNAEGGTCLLNALEFATMLASYSLGTGAVLLVSDSADACGGFPPPDIIAELQGVVADNVVIHSFYVDTPSADPTTLIALADAFGGVFVDTTIPLDFFQRGDVNGDASTDVADAAFLLSYGFVPGSPAPLCDDAADANDDGEVDPIADSITLLQMLFVSGTPPLPPPTGTCAEDPTADVLGCEGACL